MKGLGPAAPRIFHKNSMLNNIQRDVVTADHCGMMRLYQGLKRNNDDEYFESNMDRMSDSEKLPIAMGFLGAVSIPFIVGLIYLYTNK